MTALSELLKASNVDNLSVRAIEALTEKAEAGRVSHGTVNVYLNGTHGRPDDRVLRSLAEVLHVNLSALREAAGVPIGADGPYDPPDVAHRLNRRQRLALDELIKAFVLTEQETADEPSTTTAANIVAIDERRRKPPAQKRAARKHNPGNPDQPLS